MRCFVSVMSGCEIGFLSERRCGKRSAPGKPRGLGSQTQRRHPMSLLSALTGADAYRVRGSAEAHGDTDLVGLLRRKQEAGILVWFVGSVRSGRGLSEADRVGESSSPELTPARLGGRKALERGLHHITGSKWRAQPPGDLHGPSRGACL